MAEVLGFDLYDERWRDCWLAATSTARLRRKQVDFDIQKRVARLIEEFGPESEKPLTLRIYGTMIKGFCVLSNERARALFSDCERLVLMFARQPFADGDNAIKLPAAKRPRMEAALTLDIDLARVEASEAFDWTQAPLEEGALLRLGGGGPLLQEDTFFPQTFVPSLEMDGFGAAQLPQAGQVAIGGGLESGWLPKLDCGTVGVDIGAAQTHDAIPNQVPQGEVSLDAVVGGENPSQLVVLDAPDNVAPMAAPAAAGTGEVTSDLSVQPQRRPRVREQLIKPGTVYGFDAEPMLPAEGYEQWQHNDRDITVPRVRPLVCAEQMSEIPEQAEHLGPWLRLLVDPPTERMMGSAAPLRQNGVAVAAANIDAHQANFGVAFGNDVHVERDAATATQLVALEGQNTGADPAMAMGAPLGGYDDYLGGFGDGAGANAGAEAQDDRTAEVGNIIRSCLESGSAHTAFHELVPPGMADRATAACTFSALLSLASAGEFLVEQKGPYDAISISLMM